MPPHPVTGLPLRAHESLVGLSCIANLKPRGIIPVHVGDLYKRHSHIYFNDKARQTSTYLEQQNFIENFLLPRHTEHMESGLFQAEFYSVSHINMYNTCKTHVAR